MSTYKDGESLAIAAQMVTWTSVLPGTVAWYTDLDCSARNEEKCQELPSEHQEALSLCRWLNTTQAAQRGCGVHWRCSKAVWVRPGPRQSILGGPTWAGRLYRDHPGVPSKLSCSVILLLCFSCWRIYKYSWISQNWGPGQVEYRKCMVLQFLFGTDFARRGQNYFFIALKISILTLKTLLNVVERNNLGCLQTFEISFCTALRELTLYAIKWKRNFSV